MTKPTDRLEAAVYNALRDFQQTADWPQLRLAQMRQHLAEHIARDLTLTPGALPTAPDSISVADLAHALDNSTPYPIELTSTVARFTAERLLEMLTIGKRAEHPVWQSEEQSEPGEQPQPEDPEGLRLLTAKDSEPCAVRRETVQYFLECRSADGSRWESPILTLDDPDEAARQLARYRGEMPHFEYRLARETTTVVVQPLPEPAVSSAGQAPATETAPSHRAELRDQIAGVLWPLTDWDGDELNAVGAADAVLAVLYREWPWLRAEAEDAGTAVLPAPADQAAVLRWAADQIEEAQQRRDDEANDRLGYLDDRTFAQHIAVHRSGKLLRRLADQTPATQTEASAEVVVCKGFVWIGQSFATCDRCGQPAWEHDGQDVAVEGAGPFDTGRTVRPWEPGQAAAIRAKWEQPATARQAEPWDVPDARPGTTDHTLTQQPAPAAPQDGPRCTCQYIAESWIQMDHADDCPAAARQDGAGQ